ncbi:hypothetical protein SORBI_3010G137100 [Sorghum bicolor]|uniref:Uncharacterized protein n=1 Tax=Sorghum bicolor TaxID=4558 RepID=A0A194YJ00_SORBI|nr:hypothetical protein SORBI_3010G137100 [Sorghum bicolor]
MRNSTSGRLPSMAQDHEAPLPLQRPLCSFRGAAREVLCLSISSSSFSFSSCAQAGGHISSVALISVPHVPLLPQIDHVCSTIPRGTNGKVGGGIILDETVNRDLAEVMTSDIVVKLKFLS